VHDPAKEISNEKGIAYITLLFLLSILFALGMAFISKARMGMIITATRGQSMQARYLAEAAANHGMWRLLNENLLNGDIRIAHNDDDAVEHDEDMKLDDSKLELGKKEYVGVRFLNVLVPQGAVITNAYVEFKASDSDNDNTDITIQGEDRDDASRFTSSEENISTRSRTSASVTWNDIPNWTKDKLHKTPDLDPIIQEIVSRPGWSSGNAMVILFRSTDLSGKRRSYAHDGSPASSPVLHIEYEGSGILSQNSYYMHSLGAGRYGYKIRKHTDTTFATIATVGIMGDHEVHQSYVLYVKGQSEPEACNAEYVEMNQSWTPAFQNSWRVLDLSEGPFYVPGNAVVEVAIVNSKTNRERTGGVRALGSKLNRRLNLHEAENGGVDAVVMHVQADATSQIEYFAQNRNHIKFIFIGYWTCANYVEKLLNFSSSADGSWRNRNLGAYGVGAGQVAELVIANTNDSDEMSGGVRKDGSSLNRTLDIHEAEEGGLDMATMFVKAGMDNNAAIKVRAEDKDDITFYLIGYWSTPPGTYTELSNTLGSPTTDQAWEDRDLSGFGVPADAVAQIAIQNKYSSDENQIGIREKGSSLTRTITLQEAESGGSDVATLHVKTDENSIIQWYHEDVSEAHEYRLLGYWELMDTFGTDLAGHWKLDEDSGTTASDSSNKGNDGTLTNMDASTDWVSGKIDGALDFDGSNDHILVPHDPALSLINQLTVASWIYKNTKSGYDFVINKGTSGNNRNYCFGTVNDRIVFGFYNGGFRRYVIDVNLQTATWYHIAATFNNAKNKVRVYLNGAEVKNWTTNRQPLINSENLYIGRSQFGQYWDGKLDDVRIYNRVLNPVEIETLYTMGN